MDGETRHDRVESAQVGQWLVEVVPKHTYLPVVSKPLPCGAQHGWRKVECYALRIRSTDAQRCQEATVPGAEVKNSLNIHRDEIEQDRFALCPMRDIICTG